MRDNSCIDTELRNHGSMEPRTTLQSNRNYGLTELRKARSAGSMDLRINEHTEARRAVKRI